MNLESNHKRPEDFASAVHLVQTLILKRQLLKNILQSTPITTAFKLIGQEIQDGKSTEKLQATALLGKAAEISKPVAAFVLPILKAYLDAPLPRISNWGSAEDRYYLAKAISTSTAEWVGPYAAIELGSADANERKSREIWAHIAIERTKNLADALNLIVSALNDNTQSSSVSTDVTARKLNRIVLALHDLLPTADAEVGEGFGIALSHLIIEGIGRRGPQERQLRDETAISFLNFQIRILRFRFTTTLDTHVYSATGAILRWWHPARPPSEVSLRAERIARIGVESLHTLARQGHRQRTLRQALVTALGKDLVDRFGADIVAMDPSLDPEVASWLSTGRELPTIKSSPAVRDASEQGLDELVARLILSLDGQEGGAQPLSILADELEILAPQHSTTIRAAANRNRLASQWTQALSTKRSLVLLSQRGDIVQFDPALHDTDDDIQLGTSARIRKPGIVKEQEGRPSRVILKAQVEKP